MKACLHCKTFFDENDALIENNKCPECGLELVASANMPADIEKQTMEIEIASRGEWIRRMNEILGYNNEDGHHSEPCPHDLARELRKFVQDTASAAPNDFKFGNFQERAKDLLSKLRTPPIS